MREREVWAVQEDGTRNLSTVNNPPKKTKKRRRRRKKKGSKKERKITLHEIVV